MAGVGGGEVIESEKVLAVSGSWDGQETKAHLCQSLQFSDDGDQSSQILPSCYSSLFVFPLSFLTQIPLLPFIGGDPRAQVECICKCSEPA